MSEGLIRSYLSYVNNLDVDMGMGDLVELFRYSLCRLMGLDTVVASYYLMELSDSVVDVLRGSIGEIPVSLQGRQRSLEGYVQMLVSSVELAAEE